MSSNAQQAKLHDYIVIGAGPAGLQLGYYFEQEGRDYLILERAATAGHFFKKFPRHRKLISINKVFTGYEDPEVNMRFDWNSLLSDDFTHLFKDYTKRFMPPADDMVRYLEDYAERYKIKIAFDVDVSVVKKDGDLFVIETSQGEYRAKRLIVATGLFKPYEAPIEGIELAETYIDVSMDPEEFTDQRVLVIGKGNSGFETADHLIETAAVIHVADPFPLEMAWKTHFVGHLRAVNNNFLDTYQLKTQNAVLDCTIDRISKNENGEYVVAVSYTHADGEREDLVYDRIISCTGFKVDDSIFDDSCKPDLAILDKFPDLTSEWESTNVADLYFAGTLMQMRDYKKVTSGFIHGFRYNVRCLHRIFSRKYHESAWPSKTVQPTPEALVDAIIQRVNETSALWQQFGFIGDLLLMPQNGDGTAQYLTEVPVDYIHDSELGKHPDYFIITLEFGKIEGDPFNIPRQPVPESARASTFLHPVIRHYSGSELLAEHHILENLYGEWWDQGAHIEPFLSFMKTEAGASVTA